MRLLYITNGITGSGGLERVLSIKASYLAEHYNYEVLILSLNEKGKLPFYTFSDKVLLQSIEVTGNPLKYIQSYLSGIKKIINSYAPNIISVCDDGLKGFFLPRVVGMKTSIIYERHVSREIEMKHNFSQLKKISVKLKWLLMEFLAKDFERFIVLTKGNKKEWQSLKNIDVISNPLSFYPKESSNLENKKVIAVGKQSYQKGYDLLLKCWSKVVKVHPDWKLEIYGKKDAAQGLEKLATKLNIDTNVFFFGPQKNIKQAYLESSIYVMSSRYEGFGMVLIEAMSCGVPCISFDCHYGPSDIIQNDIDGFLIDNFNVQELANKIIDLIENSTKRKQFGFNAKNNVQRYLPEIILNEWDTLFKKLM